MHPKLVTAASDLPGISPRHRKHSFDIRFATDVIALEADQQDHVNTSSATCDARAIRLSRHLGSFNNPVRSSAPSYYTLLQVCFHALMASTLDQSDLGSDSASAAPSQVEAWLKHFSKQTVKEGDCSCSPVTQHLAKSLWIASANEEKIDEISTLVLDIDVTDAKETTTVEFQTAALRVTLDWEAGGRGGLFAGPWGSNMKNPICRVLTLERGVSGGD